MQRGRTWSYVIRVVDPETGISRPRWVGGFSTEREAKTARDEARVRASRHQYIDRSRMTLGDYLTTWLDGHAASIKPQTLAGYRYLVTQYVVPKIGHVRLQALQPAMLTRLYRELHESGGVRGRGLSLRTVEYVHSILRKALNDAVRIDQVLSSNPVERAKRLRRDPPGPRSVWSVDELQTFLAAARKHRLFPFFHLAAYTGARRGELLNLRWADVDLDRAMIQITGTAAVINGQRVEGSTKGGRMRQVSIDPATVRVLREHRVSQMRDQLIAGSDWAAGDYVFTRGLGLPIYPDSVSQLVPKLIDAYNHPKHGEPAAHTLPPHRLHDLRHVHATVLLLAGVPVHVVADRLGHADPSITLRVYAHVLHDDAAKAAETFARAVTADGRAL